LSPVYFRSAAAALIVFDLTNRNSFLNISEWLESFRSANSEKAALFLVGNKTDLRDMRAVEREDAEKWAAEHGAQYFETSARTGDGVSDVFRTVAAKLAGASLAAVEAHFQGKRPEELQVKPKEAGGCC
jgi:small GTP-binding protein